MLSAALHVAAKYGQVEACIALLRGGANVADYSVRGLSCLEIAACSGQTGRLLQVLATSKSADVQGCRFSSSMALYYAVRARKTHTMRDLIALGADVKFHKPGKLPNLHYAAAQGAYGVVETLLQAGANVGQKCGGKTPLHGACGGSHTSTVQLLLRWGADEKATDLDGNTPSEVVGNATERPDILQLPEEFFRNQLIEDRIRNMLETAPADRTWRRRGWLVLCRARWLSRVAEREKRSSAPLEFIPDAATGAKKRRRTPPGSALVAKPRDLSACKGEYPPRNDSRGRHLSGATAAAAVLRLGTCSVLSDGCPGQAAGVARLDGRMRLVAVVEKLLLLREDSIFREVVTFL